MRPFALLLTLSSLAFAAPPDWSGHWEGQLFNYPERPNFPKVEVSMDIGKHPAADNTCSTFRTTYKQDGEVKQVKDYQLCRGTGPEDLFIDEGNGVKLAARWLGDALVSPFRFDSTMLISTMRLIGDVLEHEILSFPDTPSSKGVQSLIAKNRQRLEFRRTNSK